MKCFYNVDSPLMLATYITLWAIITNMCSSKSNTKYAVWLLTNMYSFIKSSLSSHFWNMRLNVSNENIIKKGLKRFYRPNSWFIFYLLICIFREMQLLTLSFWEDEFLLQLDLLNDLLSASEQFKCRKLPSVKVSLNCPSGCPKIPRVLQNTLS